MIPILYLHGFASSPVSRKAVYFREQLSRCGIPMKIPDLADGDFRNLTLTGQLRILEREAAGRPVFLIGSSMGGYLAALYAARHPEVAGLILLAPAFNFYLRWLTVLGPERVSAWKNSGEMLVFHYGENRDVPLGYQLLEDAKQYEPYPDFRQPCQIFHGTGDTVVPIQYSVDFAGRGSNVDLVTVQSGHELTDVMGTIWETARPRLMDTVRRGE
jgi:hypothetical protein